MIDPYKTKAINRLKRAKGQIEGIIKMIEEDKYCMDVLTQLLALQGALKGVNKLALESHLNTCGAKALTGTGKEKFIQELIKISDLSGR